MVLVRKAGLAFAAGLLVAGCVQRSPPVKLAQPAVALGAFVLDSERPAPAVDVPRELKDATSKVLWRRNLELDPLSFEKAAPLFGRVQNSQERLQQLPLLGKEAPFYVLVETRAVFFSQLGGRYRWNVYAKISVQRHGSAEAPVTAELDVPVFLSFDHERETDAVRAAAWAIAERAGALFDSFLQAPPRELSRATPGRPGSEWEPLYFVLVDRFANGDLKNDGEVDLKDPQAFHGGDVQGVLDHLADLQELGVKTVWLSPVFKCRKDKFFGHGAFHGYWVEDPFQVDPRFGSFELLKKLSDELHRRDMKLVLDLVLNHVGPDAPLTKKHPEWFHRRGPIADWNSPEELETHDVHGLPDLAEEREDVYRYLLAAAVTWYQKVQPDGFRLDAVKHMPLGFWSRFNEDLRARTRPGFLLLGEYLDGDPWKLAAVQKKGGFDLLFDFPTYFSLVDTFCKDQPASHLAAVLAQDRAYGQGTRLATLVDNHDLPRLSSACQGEPDRVGKALAVWLGLRGAPTLTYGTEVGLVGSKEPENRADMRFTRNGPVYSELARLFKLRREHPSLREGATQVLAADKELFAFARISDDEAAVVAINQSGRPAGVDLGALHSHGKIFEVAVELPAAGQDSTAGRFSRTLEVAPRSVVVGFVAPRHRNGFRRLAREADAQGRTGAKKQEVSFQVLDAPLAEGDRLWLAGSGPEMGQWEPSHALGPFVPDQPVKAALPVGLTFEYKLVVCHESGKCDWEEGGNRFLFVREEKSPMELSLAWSRR